MSFATAGRAAICSNQRFTAEAYRHSMLATVLRLSAVPRVTNLETFTYTVVNGSISRREGNLPEPMSVQVVKAPGAARRHRILIIGGGSAGISVAARLRRAGQADVAVIEPSPTHHYQRAWTLVGGGAYSAEGTARPTKSVVPRGVEWIPCPTMPIKCPGAPQKIAYLACDHFDRRRVRDKISVVYGTATPSMFAVPEYSAVLDRVVERCGIEVLFTHNLVRVDSDRRDAFFEATQGETKKEVKVHYDFLHAVPPQSSPDFIKRSLLADPQGWIDVDKHTLRHARFPSVFGLGDATNTPNSKTGAAIRMQAPVLVEHLLAAISGKQTERVPSVSRITRPSRTWSTSRTRKGVNELIARGASSSRLGAGWGRRASYSGTG